MGDDPFGQWAKLDAFEGEQKRKTTHARELIISLPNEIALADDAEQKAFCSELSNVVVGGQPHAWALHWNASRTNLHMHLIFSERKENKERIPQVYKRDVWLKEDGTLAKSKVERHTLAHKTGDVKRDDEGNIIYQESDQSTFTKKDVRFKSKGFVIEVNNRIKDFLKQSDLVKQSVIGIEDRKPYEVRQTHIGKVHYANEDLANEINKKNELIKEWNAVNNEIDAKGGTVATKDEVATFRSALYASVTTSAQFLKEFITKRLEPLKDAFKAIYERFSHLRPKESKENLDHGSIRSYPECRKRSKAPRLTSFPYNRFSFSRGAIELPKRPDEALAECVRSSNSRCADFGSGEYPKLFTATRVQQLRNSIDNALEAVLSEFTGDAKCRGGLLRSFEKRLGSWQEGDRESIRRVYTRVDRFPNTVFKGVDYFRFSQVPDWRSLCKSAEYARICTGTDFECAFIARAYSGGFKAVIEANGGVEKVSIYDLYRADKDATLNAIDDYCDAIDIANERGDAQGYVNEFCNVFERIQDLEHATAEESRNLERSESGAMEEEWGLSL